eukprot:m51a1_g9219 putative gamma-glutamyl phosphate reductase (433) ;mRNA; f:59318-61167
MSTATATVSVHDAVQDMGRRARAAARELAKMSSEAKNAVLLSMAQCLRSQAAAVLEANARDVQAAIARGSAPAMVDRLRLDEARIAAVVAGIENVASLPDPVGETLESFTRPNGIRIDKVRTPIGVIGVVFESRPNVTADAAVLCFKAGNAVILRGGSEALESNKAIARALACAQGIPTDAIQLVPFAGHESVVELARMSEWLDLIVPRGGRRLIEAVVANARVPVIKHYDGICHVYVDAAADVDMAARIIVDSKTQKPGVCNATETLLVHEAIAARFLPVAARALRARGVELRCCERTREVMKQVAADVEVKEAVEEDWRTEYLALILSVKIVRSLAEAITFINDHGSHHTDSIVTGDAAAASTFQHEVDSACVFHNMSTRFNDGGEFGFGAEMGISTDRIHARGPMGLRELTIYQFRAYGNGQTKVPVTL